MEKINEYFDRGWWLKLSEFILSEDFRDIGMQLKKETMQGYNIYPSFPNMFRAFKECPYSKLKVVIVAGAPYSEARIADGIPFSAKYNLLDPPKVLEMIIDAMEKDVYGGFGISQNSEYACADLTRWANQGVLLLNQALSCQKGLATSHLQLWYPFIKEVFKVLNENSGLVYIFLGARAKQWRTHIDEKLNYILEASHPESALVKGLKEWDCSEIFSQTNLILEKYLGEDEKILW